MDWTLVGHCGVDSGQIILVDPCYAMADRKTIEKDQLSYSKLIEKQGEGVQEIIFSSIAGNGVLVRGFGGDGNYPVYAKIENGMTKEVKIVFA